MLVSGCRIFYFCIEKRTADMKTNKKMVYVPPTVTVTQVVCEDVIAASPVQRVVLKDWEEEGPEKLENNSDIWLNL
jgi:hypothetical protein